MQDVVSLLALLDACQKHNTSICGLLMRSNSPWYMWAILSLSFIKIDFFGQKSLLASVHCYSTVSSPWRYLVHHRSPHNLFNTKKCSISLCQPKGKRQIKILDKGNLYLYIKILKTLIFQEESWKGKSREMLAISILPYGTLSTVIYLLWNSINSFYFAIISMSFWKLETHLYWHFLFYLFL